ncbi:MAG: O-linked N-acetylglucosamine transferase family protein [Gammaproteobacteria bacterium]
MNRAPVDADKKTRALLLVRAGRTAEAKKLLTEACRLEPKDPEAWFLRGALDEYLGAVGNAKADYLRAVSLRPSYTDALNNLGAVCELLGDLAEASDWYRRAADADRQSVAAHFNLGRLCGIRGNWIDAERHLRVAVGLAPHDPRVHFNLGIALKARGANTEAIEELRTALRLDPCNVNVGNVLGNALQAAGFLEEAVVCYRSILQTKPDFAEVYNNLGSALLAQARHDEAEQAYGRAVLTRPDWAGAWSNALLALNYMDRDPSEVFAKHREWGDRLGAPSQALTRFGNSSDPDRPLRIGYVSGDFRPHSVAYFIVSILKHHNRPEFEIFCYSNVKSPDDTTAYLRGLSDHWRDIHELSDSDVVDMIRQDRIDILVDLSGHTAENRLPVFTYRPAPVQITYLGYPGTTGLSSMDYRLTDALADEVGIAEQWHTEELLRLPKGFLCYHPSPEAPEIGALPSSISRHVTFGSFNNLAKINPDVVSVWAEILRSVPESRLMIKNASMSDRATRDRYHMLFATHGIANERVDLCSRSSDIMQHLQFYNRIDIALDTFPYNGATTTCEALWMGVPIVTLAGKTHAGRVGVSLLSQVGLFDYVGADRESYVGIATRLCENPDQLYDLRRTLRDRMRVSSLCDADDFVGRIENAYRGVWRGWCATVGGDSDRY